MIKKKKVILVYPLQGKRVVVMNNNGKELDEGIVVEETKNTITIKPEQQKKVIKTKEFKRYLKSLIWIKIVDENIIFKGDITAIKQHEKVKRLIRKLKINE